MRVFATMTKTAANRPFSGRGKKPISAFIAGLCTSITLAGSGLAQAFPEPGEDAFRIRFNAEHADTSGLVLADQNRDSLELSAVAGQVEFHPFRDEFYLAAGAVQSFDNGQPEWARIAQHSPIDPLPTTALADVDTTGEQLEDLVRYFGAGIRVHSVNEWSLTVEGGAYFSDRNSDRLQMYDQTTGQMIVLQDNLDRVDRAAVGERHARSIKPVGHLVVRRRF